MPICGMSCKTEMFRVPLANFGLVCITHRKKLDHGHHGCSFILVLFLNLYFLQRFSCYCKVMHIHEDITHCASLLILCIYKLVVITKINEIKNKFEKVGFFVTKAYIHVQK